MWKRTIPFIPTLLMLAACATTPPSTLPTSKRAVVGADGAQHVDIVGGSYWFRPDRVVVKAGTPVVLAVKKLPGVVPHRFVIKEPQAGISVDMGLSTEPKTVRFTPTRAGDYAFYCDEDSLFDNHRDKGMHGVLEVVP